MPHGLFRHHHPEEVEVPSFEVLVGLSDQRFVRITHHRRHLPSTSTHIKCEPLRLGVQGRNALSRWRSGSESRLIRQSYDLIGELVVGTNEVADTAHRWPSDGGVVPMMVVEVEPAV